MPFYSRKRKTYYGRSNPQSGGKRRRFAKKGKVAKFSKRSLAGSMYTFKRFHTFTVSTENSVQEGNADIAWDDPTGYLGLSFALNDVPNASEFTTLFDQYRIKSVSVKMTPIWNNVEASNVDSNDTSEAQNMIATYVYDFDNITGILDIEELNQYQRRHQKTLAGTRSKKMFLNPRAQVRVLTAGGASTNALSSSLQWQDCADPNVPYYGIRMLVKPINIQYNPTDNFVLRFDFTYVLQFKNVR